MKYDVLIKATVEADDDLEVDVDAIGEAVAEEFDNTDIDVDAVDDDDEEHEVSFKFVITDVDITNSTD